MSTQDPKSSDALTALRRAVMALAYAAEKLPEVQKAYNDVSAAIESAVQQAADAVGPDCVRAALCTDWSDPSAGRWAGDDNIESPFNACQHRGYCMSLKAAPSAQEPVAWAGADLSWASVDPYYATVEGLIPLYPCPRPQPALPGKPVAWIRFTGGTPIIYFHPAPDSQPLYTAPQPAAAPRQPLMDGFVQVPVGTLIKLKDDVNTIACLSLKAERRQECVKIKTTIASLINGTSEGGAA